VLKGRSCLRRLRPEVLGSRPEAGLRGARPHGSGHDHDHRGRGAAHVYWDPAVGWDNLL